MDLPLLECRLDQDGLREQGGRYRSVASALEGIERGRGELRARFSPTVDDELLAEALAVERECCPFFRIAYEPDCRELHVRVDDPKLDPALDALREALTQSSRS